MATAGEFDSDSALAFFQTLGTELSKTREQALGLRKASEHTNRFTESVTRAGKDLTGMNTVLGGMAKGLLGPVGVAAGLFAVAKGLETFAQGQVQLQAFSTNTGFAVKDIEQLRQGMRRLGSTSAEADSIISSMGTQLQNLLAFKQDSELWRSLSRSEGGAVLAKNLLQLGEAGNQMGQVTLILKTFKDQTLEAKIALSEYLHTPMNVLQDLSEAMARGIEIWPVNAEKAKEYHNMWVDFEIKLYKNILPNISNHAIEAFTKMSESLGREGMTQHAIADSMNALTDEVLATLQTDIGEIKAIIDGYNKAYEFLYGSKAPEIGGNLLGRGAKKFRDQLKQEPSGLGGLFKRQKGEDSDIPANARPIMYRSEEKEIERDSNKALHDIRDILGQMEGGEGIQYGQGMRGGSSAGSFQAGVGGFRSGGGTGKSGANFLGSVRSRAAGIESGVGQNLVTVDTAAGKITVNKDAAADLKGFIDDAAAAGAPVGKAGSYSKRPIAGTNTWSQHAFGGAVDLFNQSGRGIISREGMAWMRANPEKWNELRRKHNIVGGEDFGDVGHIEWGGPGFGEKHFGTAGVGSGTVRGSTFDDASTASGLHRSIPGIALPSRAGLGKMYRITTPDGRTFDALQTDVGPAAWTKRGIDINKPLADKMGYGKNFPTDSLFSYEPVGENEKDRALVDSSFNKNKAGGNGKVSANIDFKDLPVKKSESEIFKPVSVAGPAAAQKASQSMLNPGSLAYTPWVP